jgi:hypothetical protein
VLGCDEEFPMTVPVAPWSMWGQAEYVPLNGTTVSRASPQLARINYRRPETWSFILWAQIVAGTSAGNIVVDFDLVLGVGLINIPLPTFAHFVFNGPIVAPLTKFVTAVLAPPADDAAPATRQLIDKLAAQDIQCNARLAAPDPSTALTVRVASFFTPLSHVRPDWYRTTMDDPKHAATDQAKFLGAEMGGS